MKRKRGDGAWGNKSVVEYTENTEREKYLTQNEFRGGGAFGAEFGGKERELYWWIQGRQN